ncbi:beta-ketoacyl-ACP synthase III [Desulfogranum mediterraneum]|uniref:beta-ketoacyl-ACP synthase III n=1 Tax=Desulfogranum mediterraneum TaxID=160661 RepID=UPI0004188B23|nr:beta-ketoacyl-ACP synthase III [Desulfogranum mediterraneum]
MNAYINAVSAFLPGLPVENQDLDRYLGTASAVSAKTRRIILATNGIRSRYYAIDPASGRTSYSNARLAAEAVRRLPLKGLRPDCGQNHQGGEAGIDCLCCGTSTPDQLLPGHGSMVQGELGLGPCEVMSAAGVCLTGVTALNYAAMSVALGQHRQAVASGSELASTFLRQDFFERMSGRAGEQGGQEQGPAFSFAAEFLRWMLSDGAGAVLVEATPRGEGPSLRIDWIESISHAHRLEACMYAGGVKQADGSLLGWRECLAGGGLEHQGVMTIKQDARLLNREIIDVTVGRSLPQVTAKHGLRPEQVDWFLPHYSSEYFRAPLLAQLEAIGFPIPEERWFTNLGTKGNTGSASFYIILEELVSSGRLQPGDRILAMVPESGRFSVGWLGLEVV